MTINVIIHAGAPKTGSSAIQKALSESSEKLEQIGYYYPIHNLDKNGVSSGHVENIYDRAADGSLTLSRSKIAKLLTQCEQRNCSTLLISSEFFYARMIELYRVFKDVKFVVFIRNPLAVFESNYNQSIKRHKVTTPLSFPKILPMNGLTLLDRTLAALGNERVIIRSFDTIIKNEFDVVSDFFSLFQLNSTLDWKNKRINESYTFEALELMRWLNSKELSTNQRNRFDLALQSCKSGKSGYSLIPQEVYQEYKLQALSKLEAIYTTCQESELHKLMNEVEVSEQKPFINQHTSLVDFAEVFSFLAQRDMELCYLLLQLSKSDSKMALTFSSLGPSVGKYRYRYWVSRIFPRFLKRGLNAQLSDK